MKLVGFSFWPTIFPDSKRAYWCDTNVGCGWQTSTAERSRFLHGKMRSVGGASELSLHRWRSTVRFWALLGHPALSAFWLLLAA
jgi:hypothetical protein